MMAQRPSVVIAHVFFPLASPALDHMLAEPDAPGRVNTAFALPVIRHPSQRLRTSESTHIPAHEALAAHERLKRHVYDAGYAYKHRSGEVLSVQAKLFSGHFFASFKPSEQHICLPFPTSASPSLEQLAILHQNKENGMAQLRPPVGNSMG